MVKGANLVESLETQCPAVLALALVDQRVEDGKLPPQQVFLRPCARCFSC